MKWRVMVVGAAVVLVAIAARGTSPVEFRPGESTSDPRQETPPPSFERPPESTTDTIGGYAFAGLLAVLIAFILFGLIGLALSISRTRVRKGEKSPAATEYEPPAPEVTLHSAARHALAELEPHQNRPPRDAVIAAWLRLEEATGPRAPHQTPTEFTQTLGTDTTTLRTLYQKARYSQETLTEHDVELARDDLNRIVRELT